MAKQSPEGVVFPLSQNGRYSTSRTCAAILEAALSPFEQSFAGAVRAEKNWRKNYPKYLHALIELGLQQTDKTLASAQAGLDAAWQTMLWDDGYQKTPLKESINTLPIIELTAHEIHGLADNSIPPLSIPLKGINLYGDALTKQISAWKNKGVIEQSAAEALERCIEHPEWFDLSDRYFVLLGAGSEIGPLSWLLQRRANVIAIDINRPSVWERLTKIAESGNGRMLVPLRPLPPTNPPSNWHDRAGANLITEAPSLAAWLKTFQSPLDIASLAYLDGANLMRLSMGMDMIVESLCAHNPSTTLMYLATPTDIFCTDKRTAEDAISRYKNRSFLKKMAQYVLGIFTGNVFFKPNIQKLTLSDKGQEYGITDCIIQQQGMNYALAKRLQHWRAFIARAKGIRVSINVAPSTTTASVIKNPALAAGFAGADLFDVEVFSPETTTTLMAALWIHDLRYNESTANPTIPLNHPYEVFLHNACHGGLWRCPYIPRSALLFSVIVGWVRSLWK